MRPKWIKSRLRDCLESPDGHQSRATRAGIEGRKDRIFALQASDLASSRPLQLSFHTVSLGTSMHREEKRGSRPRDVAALEPQSALLPCPTGSHHIVVS